MRKFIFIVLSVLLLFSLTTLAYAETDIKLSGRILVRGWYFSNVETTAGSFPSAPRPVDSESTALYTTNAYLTIDAKVADNVQGYMELETSDDSDAPITSGLYKWGTYDEKPKADLFFRQLWIQYTGSGLLGAPAGIKIGHQLLALGEKQFLRHDRFGDDAILIFVEPTKELFLGALTAKVMENAYGWHRDDVDANAILSTYKVDKDNTVGLNYTWIRCDDVKSLSGAPAAADYLNFQNLGLHANGIVSGLTYAAELDIQLGNLSRVALPDVDFRGYGFFAKLGYKIDPVNLRASFAIGSGDNDSTDTKNKEFQTTLGRDGVSPFARFVNYTQIYERTIRTAVPALAATGSQGQVLTLGNTRTTGIANTTYYDIGADIMPTKDLSLSLDGFIIRATKAWQSGQSKSVGTEVDLKGSYKLAKNLTYFVEAGVFDPGDYYTTGASPVNGTGVKKETVTQLVHGINLTF